MLLPRVAKGILRQVFLCLKLLWWPKLSIAHLLPTSGTVHLRRRIRLRLAFARGTRFLYQRVLLGRAVLMFHQLTCHARIVISLVTSPRIARILPSRILREMSVRGVFTIPPLRKFLLGKWSLPVSFLLMIILQLCSLIRVLHISL
jgi:hypothetical protein